MDECIFCKIAKKEIPSTIVYEDDQFLAFLDIAPANKGHTLVIPKEHYKVYTDIPEELLKKFAVVVKKVASSVHKGLEADGFNIVMNNYKVSGQIVSHAHFHILPRFINDGINSGWPHKNYEDGEMDSFKDKIKLG
jgi:histidine triad (HIT) family protein